MKRWLRTAIITTSISLASIAFCFFVWPTPWMYRVDSFARIHRVTGRVEVLTDSGWADIRRVPESAGGLRKNPLTDLARELGR